MCFQITSGLQSLEAELDLLSRYAVAFRYPGETATQEEAKAAIKAMKKVRMLIRNSLQERKKNA